MVPRSLASTGSFEGVSTDVTSRVFDVLPSIRSCSGPGSGTGQQGTDLHMVWRKGAAESRDLLSASLYRSNDPRQDSHTRVPRRQDWAMRILSLGAGVQSSTLLLMACEGELEIDCAIFADTQWEPAAVYGWLDVLAGHAARADIPIHRVTKGSIRELTLSPAGTRFASLPLYVRQENGALGIGRRQCTKEYKLRPIQKLVVAMGATAKKPVDMAIGISLDEHQRMRDSRVKYVRNIYPLIDKRMTRGDCLHWLEQHGYPEPQKSACIGCPYRRNSEWRKLTPGEMADAVDFDTRIRNHNHKMTGQQFVHRSFVPLADVDFRSEQDRGQTEMFENDGCGVLCPADDAA